MPTAGSQTIPVHLANAAFFQVSKGQVQAGAGQRSGRVQSLVGPPALGLPPVLWFICSEFPGSV